MQRKPPHPRRARKRPCNGNSMPTTTTTWNASSPSTPTTSRSSGCRAGEPVLSARARSQSTTPEPLRQARPACPAGRPDRVRRHRRGPRGHHGVGRAERGCGGRPTRWKRQDSDGLVLPSSGRPEGERGSVITASQTSRRRNATRMNSRLYALCASLPDAAHRHDRGRTAVWPRFRDCVRSSAPAEPCHHRARKSTPFGDTRRGPQPLAAKSAGAWFGRMSRSNRSTRPNQRSRLAWPQRLG